MLCCSLDRCVVDVRKGPLVGEVGCDGRDLLYYIEEVVKGKRRPKVIHK